ncbi:phosphodiesterase/nucleotide pyrophosphatase domain protein [Natrialba magadii ATCC 43099]|uniref:Phosphodiesterase/nucleotide pyrophosphatase domain protein n=1 Tax=Natrialba magadii (strain ATCC 43099 / DSM 3394 / CCM 3739 / CIP 104546 / IAM 13178 / JCM 8861 / NBRC 102185 / NCIMB 2190 / MS3) TaxID=547559 RepID=D3SXK0_NATMM|nr:alkaline phosphatase family protein [Natrialba magadii]ADD05949.1 phosphodiesterase/nucleotide pyrophosphatase domain protein [Natrialba magadii ATCC 43099]ELY30543.1 type I phosphodiesterase/nucleotide pyrophosphatase [Natrialba magadii ATCC 43099]
MLQESVERQLFTTQRAGGDFTRGDGNTGTDEDAGRGEYWFPAYDDYCVANVPETALSLLSHSSSDTFEHRLPKSVFDGVDLDGIDTVVLFLLDGFGYEHWKRDYRDHDLLARITDQGTVTPLTSIYPSETAAAITTLQTGSLPVEHGLLGWYQYLESADQVITTLPFLTTSGEPLESVAPDADPRELFDAETLYARAADEGIDSYVIQPEAYADSGYSRASTAGAERIGYDDPTDLAATIREVCESSGSGPSSTATSTPTRMPTYIYAYEPTIDAVSHVEGTTADRYQDELATITTQLQQEFVGALESSAAERTLLLVTADHGLVDTVPSENIEMGTWDDWPAIRESFRRDEHGEPRLPTGSPRNVHFHVQPDRIADVRERLETHLGDEAMIVTREVALEGDLFGPGVPSSLFESRCGDLLVIHRNRGLSWPLPGTDESAVGDQIGLHGGLTREEMLVPLAAVRLDSLRG